MVSSEVKKERGVTGGYQQVMVTRCVNYVRGENVITCYRRTAYLMIIENVPCV